MLDRYLSRTTEKGKRYRSALFRAAPTYVEGAQIFGRVVELVAFVAGAAAGVLERRRLRLTSYTLAFSFFTLTTWNQVSFVSSFFLRLGLARGVLFRPRQHTANPVDEKTIKSVLQSLLCIVWLGHH